MLCVFAEEGEHSSFFFRAAQHNRCESRSPCKAAVCVNCARAEGRKRLLWVSFEPWSRAQTAVQRAEGLQNHPRNLFTSA